MESHTIFLDYFGKWRRSGGGPTGSGLLKNDLNNSIFQPPPRWG
jgi:hypothetical protein